MSEVEHRPLDRGAGPLLRGWRLGEREGEGGKWAAINPHTLPLAARLAVLSTISPNALDIPAATGTLPVAPNPLAALFDNHDVLATWPSADTPIGVPFGAPVQRSSVRRAWSSSGAQPASPSSAQLRTADLRAEVPSNQSGAAQRAEGPTQRSSAGPAPSAPPPAAPVEPLAPSSDGRLSVAEVAQRLLAAGGKPTLAVTTRREPPPQVVDENAEGPGPLIESSRAEVAGPFDNWPSDPPPLSPSGWVESAPGQPGEAGPAAQSSKNSSPQQRQAAPAPAASSGAASVVEQVPASERPPASSPVSGPGGSSVSGGVAAWPGDSVGGAASGDAPSGGVDAVAEVRRANIARVLEAGGGRPSVVVSGGPGPGSVVAPAPSPAPAASSGAASVVEQVPASERPPASSPVSGPGGSSVSGGVAAWPGDPLVDRGRAPGGGDGRSSQRTGERIADRTTQSEARFPGASRQPEPVRQAGEAILKSRESQAAAERSRVSTTDVAGTTEPPNSLPPRPVSADPAATSGGLPPQGGAEVAPAANPTVRRVSEQVLGLGFGAAAEVGFSALARTPERMTSASRPRGVPGQLAPSSASAPPPAQPTVAESVASRSARREQPGVLGQQAPVVNRSGGAGSSLGSPVVDRERGAGSMPSAVVPDSGTVSAESLAAQPQRPPARPTVAESVASRSARREQPGVLGQQAPVVNRSGGAGSSLGSPVVDRERGAGSMPSAVVPDSGTVSAESLVARLQGRGPQTGRAKRQTPPSPAPTPQPSTPVNQRSVPVPSVRGPIVAAPPVSSASPSVSMKSETIRRSPADSGSDSGASDEPSNDFDIDALTDEIERRLQRRLRLGFDRRGGFRGGGRSWPR